MIDWTKLPAPTGVEATDLTHNSATVTWNKVSHATSYELKAVTAPNCGGTETASTIDQPEMGRTVSTALSLAQPERLYRFCVRAVQTVPREDGQGDITRESDWSFGTETTLAETSDLEITSATTTWQHCVEGVDQVPVEWQVTGGESPYTVADTTFPVSVTSGTATLRCPAAAGPETMSLVVTDASEPQQSATAQVAITVTAPLSLSAVADPPSCELGEDTEIVWALTGGGPPYDVLVEGQRQPNTQTEALTRARRTSVDCNELGNLSIGLRINDSSQPNTLTLVRNVIVLVEDPEPELSLSATTSWRHCLQGEDQVPVEWQVSGGESPYTLAGTTFLEGVSSGKVDLLWPGRGRSRHDDPGRDRRRPTAGGGHGGGDDHHDRAALAERRGRSAVLRTGRSDGDRLDRQRRRRALPGVGQRRAAAEHADRGGEPRAPHRGRLRGTRQPRSRGRGQRCESAETRSGRHGP